MEAGNNLEETIGEGLKESEENVTGDCKQRILVM